MSQRRVAGGGWRGPATATLVAAFAAVILGLAVVDVVVLGTLQPQLSQLASIGDDHARAVLGATRLRDGLSDLRRRITATVIRSQAAFDPAPGLMALGATLDEIRSLCNTDTERAALARIDASLQRAHVDAEQVERAIESGDRLRGMAALGKFADAAADASRAADDIVQFNAGEMRATASAVHRALARAMLVTSGLAGLVVIAAILLLRSALRSLSMRATLLERHAEEMSAFAARAAHELRSPLQTLTLTLAALRERSGSSALLDRADASARRLSSTLHEILEFSMSGGAIPPGTCCSVELAARAVGEELNVRAADEQIEILWEIDPSVHVAMSSGHLGTVLSNLIQNAVKYGSRPGRVSVSAAVEGSRVRISVADDGPGISPTALERIFDPFFRDSSRSGGYGLGLATVKRLVDAHGGRITVTSSAGAGTLFSVDLPSAGSGGDAPAASQRRA